MKKLLALALALGLRLCAQTGEPPLIPDGDFEATDTAWPLPPGAAIVAETNNHFLRLQADAPDLYIATPIAIPVSPGHEAYRFDFRARFAGIIAGTKQWHDGRIILDFKDAEGRRITSPPPPYFKKTSSGWIHKTIEFTVPDHAATLEITPVLFNVRAGTLDLDDLSLVPIPAAPVITRQEATAAARAADTARRAALVKPRVPAPPADQMPPALRVTKNQIQTDDGREVWLQGLAVPSLVWVSNGERVLESIQVALDDWRANCIRLPVNDRFWIGKGPYQKDGGAAYRQLVEDAANLCASRGAYLILDLHRFRAPEQRDIDFWHDAASRFKNHPAILFDLFNEPHDISWQVWQNGGPTGVERTSDAPDENDERLRVFESVGMQRLVDTVRAAGAENIVIVGGLDWAYDLSGILDGHALEDPAGRGIVYSTHVYPWKRDWQGKFLEVARLHPVLVGELGSDPKPLPPPRDNLEPSETWVPDMLGLIQKHRLHWTAWCFHHSATPRMIEDWTFAPTPYWGQYVKDALAGKQFELHRLR